MSKYPIGIIGFGSFAQLLIAQLGQDFQLYVASNEPPPDHTNLECEFVDLEFAASQPVVIPCIPAQSLELFFQTYARYVQPGAIVIDVCSVKVKPVAVLQRLLPPEVFIIATHPLFGPATASNGLAGQRIMIYPARIPGDVYAAAKEFIRDKLGMKIIECTPEEHDRAMAYVQGLSHYIGRAMQVMDIPESELMTAAYQDLLDMKQIQGNDSWALFRSIMHENPYAMDVNKEFKAALKQLDAQIQSQR